MNEFEIARSKDADLALYAKVAALEDGVVWVHIRESER